MLLFYRLRTWINILFFTFISAGVFSQKDTSSVYTLYRLNPIVAVDVGFSSAPFNIKYPFNDQGLKKLAFRHNHKGMLGFMFAYKWFSLRLGAGLLTNIRPQTLYGKAKYIDISAQGSFRNFQGEVDYRNYRGYVLENATWNPDYSIVTPNDMTYNVNVYDIGAKLTFFQNKNFKIDAFNANRGIYNKKVFTWYLLSRLDIFGLLNNGKPIIPPLFHDSTNTKTGFQSMGAVEFGVMPGFGHANRIKDWQYGVLIAVGPRMQFKNYRVNDDKTTKAGIVPRYDLRLMVAYTKPSYFVGLHFEIDNKGIHFNDLKYNQTFFNIRLQGGWRFKETSKEIRQARKNNFS